MGSRRPISAILAVFGGLEIGLRCARYAGWVCIRCIYDLRRPPGYSLSPQKSVKRIFRGQKAGRSWFSVRHDAGVFRPNGRHQRNANGEKTLKPRSFGFWGGRTKKVEATSLNQRPAKCAIVGSRKKKKKEREMAPAYSRSLCLGELHSHPWTAVLECPVGALFRRIANLRRAAQI